MSEHNTVEKGDALIERARGEIRVQAATLRERPLLEREGSPVARDERIDRARLDYRIGELTDAHHHAFVEQAFHALLKRAPTQAETDAHLALLAAGATKAEALGNLRWSPEGRAVGVRVAGLAPRYAMAKLRRVPLLGYLVDIPLNLAALPALARHQRATDAMLAAGDAAAAQSARELGARVEALDASTAHAFDQHARERVALREQATRAHQRIDDLHAFAHELNVARDELARLFDEANAWTRARLDVLERATGEQCARLDDLEILRRQLHGVNRWRDALDAAFARLDTEVTVHGARNAQEVEASVRSILASTALPHTAWADALARRLVPDTRVLTPGGDPTWSSALAARGFDVVELAGEGDDAAQTRLRWSRCADASVGAASVLSLPALAAGTALPVVLAEIRRVVAPGGLVLCAFARDAAALRAALCGAAVDVFDAELAAQALVASGFVDVERRDVEGVATLLARVADA